MPGTIKEWNGVAWVARLGQSLLTKADLGLGNVDNTSDANKPVSTAQQTALDAKEPSIAAPGTTTTYWRGDKSFQTLDKAAVGLGLVDNTSDLGKPVSTAQATINAAKADLVSGVVPTSQIPALALVSTQVVASQAAMLALTTVQVQPGDLAVRTDGAGTFILTATDPSVLANWTRLNAPTDVVVSVNGQVGTVVLGKGDVGLGLAENTTDLGKPISTATQTALNAKEPTIAAGTASQFWRGDKSWAPINGANLVQNPGFEDGLTPHWVAPVVDLAASGVPKSGSLASHHQVTAVGAANTDVFVANGAATSQSLHPRCAVGESYRAEFWVRNGVANTTAPTLRAFLKAMDSTGTAVQTVLGTATLVTTTYTLYSVEMTVSAATAQYVTAGLNSVNALAVADAWRIDDIALRWIPPISTVTQAALDAKGTPLATAVTNTSANSVYPDNSSYFRAVASVDGFPAPGLLTGQRVGTSHVQSLNSQSGTTTFTRYWIQGAGAWSAWVAYLDSSTYLAKGDIHLGTGPAAWAIQSVGTDGQVLVADSTQSTGVRWDVIPMLSSRLTAAVSNSTATFAATGLSVNVVAGKTYLIRARGQYQAAATTGGMGMNLAGTATATGIRAELTIKGLTTTTNGERSLNSLGQNTASNATAAAAGVDYHWSIDGEIRVSGSGTLIVQFRSNSTTAVTVEADSTLVLQEIA